MSTQNPRVSRAVQDEKGFLWLVEQEKFRNNVKNLQRLSEELGA